MNLKENIALKEQFKLKCDQVQEMYENLFKEAQVFKRQIVGVDEIKKDRDARVASLRSDIDELTEKLDEISAEHASLQVQHKNLQEENTRLNNDYSVLGKNLHLSNEVRQQAEENLVELQKQYKSIKEAFMERDLLMMNYRRKFEDEQKKLTDCERKAD